MGSIVRLLPLLVPLAIWFALDALLAPKMVSPPLAPAEPVLVTLLTGWTVYLFIRGPQVGLWVWAIAAVLFAAGAYGLGYEWERWSVWSQTYGWPPPFSALPYVYWPLIAISLVSLISSVGMPFSAAIVKWLQGYRGNVRPGNDLHGTARWMNERERRARFSVDDGETGDCLVVGEDCDVDEEPERIGSASLLLYNVADRGHAITVGPTGMGKTRGLVCPNLLHWTRSVVCLDIKGDLSQRFTRARQRMGRKIVTLDVNAAGGNTDSLDILSWLDPHGPTIIADTRTVAGWLGGEDPKHDSNPSFRGNAKDLVQLGLVGADLQRPDSQT